MELEVAPEPEPDERRAIAEALEVGAPGGLAGVGETAVEPEAYASPWWRAGLDGSVALQPPQATARRRNSAGAPRA